MQRPGSLLSDVRRRQVEQCIRPELPYARLYWIQRLLKILQWTLKVSSIVKSISLKIESYLRGQLSIYYRRSNTMVERNGGRCMDAVIHRPEDSWTILVMVESSRSACEPPNSYDANIVIVYGSITCQLLFVAFEFEFAY